MIFIASRIHKGGRFSHSRNGWLGHLVRVGRTYLILGGFPLKYQDGPMNPSVEFPPSRGLLNFADVSSASIRAIWGVTHFNFSWDLPEKLRLSISDMI